MSALTGERHRDNQRPESAGSLHDSGSSKPASNMRAVGAFIGGSFGLAFVLINASSPPRPSAATTIRILGCCIRAACSCDGESEKAGSFFGREVGREPVQKVQLLARRGR